MAVKKKKNRYKARKNKDNPSASLAVCKQAAIVFLRLSAGFLAISLVSFMLLFLYRWVVAHPFWGVQSVVVKGNQRLDYGQILEQAGIRPGQSSLEVNIAAVQQGVEAMPWVEEAVVKRILPDILEIDVKEKIAVFWFCHKGRVFYADIKGRLIAPLTPEKFASLPVIYAKNQDELRRISQLANFLEDKSLPFGLQQVAWIRVHAGELFEIALMPGPTVIIDAQVVKIACSQVSRVWEHLRQQKKLKGVKRIFALKGRVWVES